MKNIQTSIEIKPNLYKKKKENNLTKTYKLFIVCYSMKTNATKNIFIDCKNQ